MKAFTIGPAESVEPKGFPTSWKLVWQEPTLQDYEGMAILVPVYTINGNQYALLKNTMHILENQKDVDSIDIFFGACENSLPKKGLKQRLLRGKRKYGFRKTSYCRISPAIDGTEYDSVFIWESYNKLSCEKSNSLKKIELYGF